MTCEGNATKFLITFLILISVINLFSFAKGVAFEIDEEDSPKWVIELFQNENERYVYRKFKIPSNDIILYGAAETEDETSAQTYFLKRDTNVETERKSRARLTEVTVDRVYTVALTNDTKVVLAKFDETASV